MMKNRFCWLAVMAGLLVSVSAFGADKIRVLLITGGHAFETNQFHQLFKDNPAITVEAVTHPQAHARLKSEAAKDYDVIAMYDMWQPITAEAKADFLARVKEGKGIVAMHHCLGNYQDWPEYQKIIGGRYLLKKKVVDGVEKPGSTYKHDVEFKVHVEAVKHPVTRGLVDFEIHDETYGGLDMDADVTPLLTTEEKTSAKTLAWVKVHEGTRIAAIQLGHDHLAWDNPSYRKLLAQAIAWTAKRD